jgi:predicted transcriptional regulator
MTQLIAREWNGKTIRQRENGYINLTDMAKACGKEFSHWYENKGTKELIQAVADDLGIPRNEVIEQVRGGSDIDARGTWGHRYIAIEFAGWLNVQFKLQVIKWTDELMQTGKVELQNHPEQELDSLAVLRQMLDTFEKQQKELKEQKAQLKQHDSKILECELDILETQNEVETLAQKINYYQNRPDLNNAMFTIDQYCRLNNLDPTRGGSISAGKKLTKICRLAEIEFNDNGVRKNEYPNWLLKALFDTVKDFHSNVVELLQKYLEYQINNE